MNRIDAISEIIKNWSENTLLSAWNDKCEKECDSDGYIYYMDSFDDFFCGKSPLEIAEMLYRSNFSPNEDYFSFDGYGNIYSFSYVEDANAWSYDELAEFIGEKGDDDYEDVDRDELISYFCDEYSDLFEDYNSNISEVVIEVMDEEGFDILTDDWDNIKDYVIEKLDLLAIKN